MIKEIKKEILDYFQGRNINLIDIKQRKTNQGGIYFQINQIDKNPIFIDLDCSIILVEVSLAKNPIFYDEVDNILNVLKESILTIQNSKVEVIKTISFDEDFSFNNYYQCNISFIWRKIINGI